MSPGLLVRQANRRFVSGHESIDNAVVNDRDTPAERRKGCQSGHSRESRRSRGLSFDDFDAQQCERIVSGIDPFAGDESKGLASDDAIAASRCFEGLGRCRRRSGR